MQPGAVAHAGLDGVAEGVAEVEQRALTAFALVLHHHLGLVAAGTFDGIGQHIGIARQQRIQVGFQPGEESRVADQSVFDHLGETGGQLAVRECVQRCRVGDHAARLVERADHVLAERVIDAGLAAHRGVDLRQQRGRHLDEIHTALIAGGGKSGDIADHTAAQRDEGDITVAAVLQQCVEDAVQNFQCLVLLAVRQDDVVLPEAVQSGAQPFQIQGRDRFIADHQHLPAGDMRREQVRAAQQTGTDVDGITALAEFDIQSVHACSIKKKRRDAKEYGLHPRTAMGSLG